MKPKSEGISRIVALLIEAPPRLEKSTHGVQLTRLQIRSDIEPWSVCDILAHLRACSDVWGNRILAMITQDNPTRRYVSPGSWTKKPKYIEEEFETALDLFSQGRHKLVRILTDLDIAGWERPGTFTGSSTPQRNRTVFSYSERIVNHEQPHLDQIDSLLQQTYPG